MTLQTKFWSYLKRDKIPNIMIYFATLKANIVLYFFHIQVSFQVLFSWTTWNHFLKEVWTVAVENGAISKDYVTASTSNFVIQGLLTAVNSFLYVNIHFRTFIIAIRPNQSGISIIT